MALPSSPADPPPSTAATTTAAAAAATATTTTAPRLFSTAPPSRPSTPSFPQLQPQPHYFNHQRPHLAAPYPNLAPRVPAAASIHPQLAASAAKPHDHPAPRGILYPVASSGRGFLPKAVRPDPTVTIANPGVFRVGSGYPHAVRGFGFPNPESVHLLRPANLQYNFLGAFGSNVVSGTVKGVPVSTGLKVAPSQPSVSDGNGYKDQRERSRDDSFATVRDRKVRICEGSSLYALCRSWLRNGFPEESQPQFVDGARSLPKPSSTPVEDTPLPMKKEGDKEEGEEDEKSIDNLSPKDLLQRHVKRAKRVRARLREVRLQRIARYKTRLALLLPPLTEQQQLTNDTATSQ